MLACGSDFGSACAGSGACSCVAGGDAGGGAAAGTGAAGVTGAALVPGAGVTPGGADCDAFAGAFPDAGSPKTTLAFAGRRRTAVAQSVGAGWRSGGTPSIQMRHMPGGGRKAPGTAEDGAAL